MRTTSCMHDMRMYVSTHTAHTPVRSVAANHEPAAHQSRQVQCHHRRYLRVFLRYASEDQHRNALLAPQFCANLPSMVDDVIQRAKYGHHLTKFWRLWLAFLCPLSASTFRLVSMRLYPYSPGSPRICSHAHTRTRRKHLCSPTLLGCVQLSVSVHALTGVWQAGM